MTRRRWVIVQGSALAGVCLACTVVILLLLAGIGVKPGYCVGLGVTILALVGRAFALDIRNQR